LTKRGCCCTARAPGRSFRGCRSAPRARTPLDPRST
jgi:hypothetical protein